MNPSPTGASAEQLVLIATPLIRRLTRGEQRPVSVTGESAAA